MYTKVKEAIENSISLEKSAFKIPRELGDLKKEVRITEPLTEEQYEELLTMTGPPQTA
ncbi:MULTISPECIES: hypothetical protein [Shimia]|uniref:hypothetical protein n=1 Tax=Shimia TaxID=573139 RepID=UPI001FB4781B|nr:MULTISPECIES: hypothetical protein [Shimia]MDV4146542.1 hypothetical protein [Shimia sp. FJ5]